MPLISNLVHQQTVSTGSGNIVLSAASGRQSFYAAFGSGGSDMFFYFISHKTAAEWEVGTGHLADAATLVRDTVISSSNANAAVNFSVGEKDVVNDIAAARQLVLPASPAAGDLLHHDGSGWTRLPRGGDGQFLSADASALAWADLAAVAVSGAYADLGGKPALGTLAAQDGTFSGASSGTNTGDQTITLTGDVTGSGTGTFAASLANDAVTNARLADMATATLKGRTTAGTGDPEDLTATQATALLNNVVGDSGSGGTKGLVPAPAAGDAAASKFLRADGSWAAASTAAAGSSTQVQYNNAAAFAGAAKLAIDAGGNANLGEYTTTAPATPSAGNTVFSKNRAGRRILANIDPNAIISELQPNLGTKKIALWTSYGGGTTVTAFGIQAPSNTGTVSSKVLATTNLSTSLRATVYTSAGTAGASAGFKDSAQEFWRGNAAGLGGFDYRCRFLIKTVQTDMRWFVGLRGATTNMGNVNPSTLVNLVGFGIDSTQTTVRFFNNDNAGTATATDLGANFPATTAAVVYEARIFCKPNDSVIYYSLERFDSAQFTEGSVSSDLPVNTTFLSPEGHINNGTTAAAVAMEQVLTYIETEY